jgi:hypothetical protein
MKSQYHYSMYLKTSAVLGMLSIPKLGDAAVAAAHCVDLSWRWASRSSDQYGNARNTSQCPAATLRNTAKFHVHYGHAYHRSRKPLTSNCDFSATCRIRSKTGKF